MIRFDRPIPEFDCLLFGIGHHRVLNPRRESVRSAGPGAANPLPCASALKASSRLSDNNENKPKPALPPDIMAVIGRKLRAMYADIIAEGVPEREILRRLDEPSNEGSRNDPTPPTI
jgi:hypothetical protein